MKHKIAVLPGDGIGPEIMAEAIKVLEAVQNRYDVESSWQYADVGCISIDRYGEALTEAPLAICADPDAILFGWGAARNGSGFRRKSSRRDPQCFC